MVPIRPHGTAAPDDAVHRLGDSDRKPADPALKEVIRLDAEVQHPELLFLREAQRVLNDDEHPGVSERGNGGACPQRHVDGAVPIVRGATSMRYGSTSRTRLPPGAGTPSTPAADRKLQLLRP